MKLLVTLFCFFCLNAVFAGISCNGEHWIVDGVFMFTGGENCSGRIATCSYRGTKQEGWYSYSKKGERRLGFTNCAADIADDYKPSCENVGTKSEGWYVAGNLMEWSKCSNEEAACVYRGTRNEGWYSYKKSTQERILWDHCSDDN